MGVAQREVEATITKGLGSKITFQGHAITKLISSMSEEFMAKVHEHHHPEIDTDITESLVRGALQGAHSNAAFPWCVEMNNEDGTFSVSPALSQTGPAVPPDAPPVVSTG